MAEEKARDESLSVTVAVDGCRLSQRAFEVARALVKGDGRFTVLHVSDAKAREMLPHITPGYLRQEYDLLCTQSGLSDDQYAIRVVDMKTAPEQAKHRGRSTKEVLLEEARETHADLFVLGSFGMKGTTIWAVGSSADWSMRRSSLHTLIVRPDAFDDPTAASVQPKRIVCCVDGTSDMTGIALAMTRRVSGPASAVTVMHVRDDWLEANGKYSVASMRKDALQALRGVGTGAEVVVEDKNAGEPVSHQVCRFLQACDADLAIIGVDGMTAFLERRPVLGSVTDYIVKHARCNVLICKRR